MEKLNLVVQKVIDRIAIRSNSARSAYLKMIDHMANSEDSDRKLIGCSNLAHAAAGACAAV